MRVSHNLSASTGPIVLRVVRSAKWGRPPGSDRRGSRQRPNHLLTVTRGRLEEHVFAIDSIDDPRVLPIHGRLGAADHAADIELGLHANLGQFLPGPQREVLAVASSHSLEGAGLLPDVSLMERSSSDTYSHVVSQATMSWMDVTRERPHHAPTVTSGRRRAKREGLAACGGAPTAHTSGGRRLIRGSTLASTSATPRAVRRGTGWKFSAPVGSSRTRHPTRARGGEGLN